MSEQAVAAAQPLAGDAASPARPRPRLRLLLQVGLAVLASSVPLILFAGYLLWAALGDERAERERLLESEAAAVARQVDAAVGGHLRALQTLALSPLLDQPDLARFREFAARVVRETGGAWAGVSLVDAATGQQLVNTLLEVAAPLPRTLGPEPVARVAASRRPAVVTRLPDPEAAYPLLRVALLAPVVRDGAARHVLGAVMPLDAVQALLVEQLAPGGRFGAVADGEWTILARTREPERFVGTKVPQALIDPVEGKDSGVVRTLTRDGEEVYAGFQRAPLTGWLVTVAAARGELDALRRRSVWALAGAGMLSFAIAGATAAFLVYSLAKRRAAAARLAATQRALEREQRSAAEREVLLKEIHHRVKNNLAVVRSLLQLGARGVPPEARGPFDAATRRVQAMARVHTLLYGGDDLSAVDLRDYLTGLAGDLRLAFDAERRGVRLALEAEPLKVPLDTAVPVGLIVTEALTNAFAHAFPEGRGGTVEVAARREGGSAVLTVRDDGVPMPEGKAGPHALGLVLMSRLAQQVGGTARLPAGGRKELELRFPLPDRDDRPPTSPVISLSRTAS